MKKSEIKKIEGGQRFAFIKDGQKLSYRIHRTEKCKFFPTIGGYRVNGTNFARKYDAKGLVQCLIEQMGISKLQSLMEIKK